MAFTRRPLFWVLFSFIAVASTLFTFKYFSTAISIVNIDISCNREQALDKAQQIAHEYHLGPDNPHSVATFQVDSDVKTFVELEAGGKEAFKAMLEENYYSPYQWYVRLFREYEKNEVLIHLKPDGTPYGFSQELSEDEKGQSLEQDAARALAEKYAPAWQVNLSEYKLVEQSKEAMPSGRVDHTFVYERPDIRIGDGYYRLRIKISGDKLTEFSHFIKVPEAFSLKYKELRSANNSIASAAKLAMMLLYLIGCCIIALFFFLRRNAIIWKTPIMWGVGIAFAHVLVEFNQLPLQWFSYPTALSPQGFLLKVIIAILYEFLTLATLYSVSFVAAESLTRAAFGNHIQLWRTWKPSVASSYAMLGRTLSAYLYVPIDFAFCVLFSIITVTYFGWWNPSDALVDPNILAHYVPWLSPIIYSLGAGFWEECLFRAVPLSTAALIGNRWGNKKFWMILAFIIQTLIFGAAHANYAAQPAYSRIIELIFFSITMGVIYLRFGLIPTIVTHFAYDVVWFALPIFVASTPGAWFNQLMIIALTFIPLFVVFYGRFKTGSFHELDPKNLNAAWQTLQEKESDEYFVIPDSQILVALHKYYKAAILGTGAFGLLLWAFTTRFHQDATPISLNLNQAITTADNQIEQKKIALGSTWQPLTSVSSSFDENQTDEFQHRWIWQKGGSDLYHKLLGSYLKPPRIVVRYATFSPSVLVADRAEEYYIALNSPHSILRTRYLLPEAKQGESFEEAQARDVAHQALKDLYDVDYQTVKEISATADKKPNRKDWTFIFENKADYPLSEGQARILIIVSGATVLDALRYIHVPELWERTQQNKKNLSQMLQLLCMLFLYLILCFALFTLLRASKFQFSYKHAMMYALPLLSIFFVSVINSWPALVAKLNTSEPFANQMFMHLARFGLLTLGKVVVISIALAALTAWRLPYKPHAHAPLLFGTCLGFLVAGLYAFAQKISPSSIPLWAEYEALGNYMPWLAEITSAIIAYVSCTLLVLLIYTLIDIKTKFWQQKKIIGIGIFLCFGILISGMHSIESLSAWIMGGLGIGILLTLLYIIIGRYDRQVVPVITGIFYSTLLAQQAFFNAYPGAMVGNILSIIIVLGIAFLWTQQLEKKEI